MLSYLVTHTDILLPGTSSPSAGGVVRWVEWAKGKSGEEEEERSRDQAGRGRGRGCVARRLTAVLL